jgi:hypothetical protein
VCFPAWGLPTIKGRIEMRKIAALLVIIALLFSLSALAQRGRPVEDQWSVMIVSETNIPGQGLVTVIVTGGRYFVLFNGTIVPAD